MLEDKFLLRRTLESFLKKQKIFGPSESCLEILKYFENEKLSVI